MQIKKTTAKRILAAALAVLVAAAFIFVTPEDACAKSKAKKCGKPKIIYAKSARCSEITLKYKGAGKNASTYFVYIKAPGGKYKLAAKTKYKKRSDGKKAVKIKKLKADTKYTIKVQSAKAYKQKQWYNKKTKKWQTKKPKKKNRGKSRKVVKYRWKSACAYKSVKTKNHSYEMTTTQPGFLKAGSKSGKCKWCSKKTSSTFGTAGRDQALSVKITLMQDAEGVCGAFVSWTVASGAAGYIVERAEEGGTYTDIFYSAAAYYFDTDIEAGKTYSYRVTAYDGETKGSSFGKESSSKLTSGDPAAADLPVNEKTNKAAAIPHLSAPKITSVTQTHIAATIKWTGDAKAKKYSVYCGDEKVAETTEKSFTVTGLTPKTKYAFSVQAHRDSLNSTRSGVYEVTTTSVPVPKNIRTAGTWDSITLSWDAVEGADGYQVFMESPKVKEKCTATSYTFTGLEANKKYKMNVCAYINDSYSDKQSSLTIGKTGFQAPANLHAERITETTAILAWEPVDGADSYRIYKANGTSVVATTENCSYKLKNLDRDKEYTYYVAAGTKEDGTYGLVDEDNKVTFKTFLIQQGFNPDPNITLTYGGTTFYLGQTWNTTLLNNLKATSDGFEQVTRPGFAHVIITNGSGLVIKDDIYDVTKYMFDTDDYSDFLAIEVADGKIIQWETNGPLFGTYYGEDVSWGDDVRDYLYGSYSGYRTNNAPCNNIFTDIDRGDTVIGGFSFTIYVGATRNIDSEKRIGFHYINAYRAAAGLSIVEYSDALDGHDYTWTGDIYGKHYEKTRFGAQPLAETLSASGECTHGTEDLTQGPLAGISVQERGYIIKAATGLERSQEIIASGDIGEACLGAYLSSALHLKQIVYTGVTRIGIGLCGKYNAVLFNWEP